MDLNTTFASCKKTASKCFVLAALLGTCIALPQSAIAATASESVMHSFVGNPDGAYSYSSMVQGSDGNFYGTTVNGGLGGVAFRITPDGASSILHSFGSGTDGASPYAGLTLASDGSFYGATANGGINSLGTLFKMTPSGAVTILHSFAGAADGAAPMAAPIEGRDGNFYGTTNSGGPSNFGTVYKLTPTGVLTTLYTFSGGDGQYPSSVLVQGNDGDFYGTTTQGGPAHIGSAFKITSAGTLTILHIFNGSDGIFPNALILGRDGNFYSTTRYGGATDQGTVFMMTPVGAITTLHSFSGGSEGASPTAGLVEGSNGDLFGTTIIGGSSNKGTVFEITPAGALTTLYSFTGGGADGDSPNAAVVQGNDGYFYGTTTYGGANNEGVVYRLVIIPPPTGTITVSPIAIKVGQQAKLTWSSTNAGACTASGAWAGAKPTSGSQFVSPPYVGLDTYVLTCTQGVDTTINSATLLVSQASTKLIANPLVASLVPGATLYLKFSGTLLNSSTNPAIGVAGRKLVFSAGSVGCSAVTDATGNAQCSTGVSSLVGGILNVGYTASFAGDSNYTSATARGAVVLLNGTKIGN